MRDVEFICKGCGDKRVVPMKITDSRKEYWETPCVHCGGLVVTPITSSPKIVSGVSVRDKRPEGWKDVLRKVHKGAGSQSTVDV